MALSNINVPVKELKSPPSWGSRAAIKNVIGRGWAKYGKFFQQAAQTSNIPVELLVAFAAVESNIDPNALNVKQPQTQGMMQWDRRAGYADKVLTTEYKTGRMSEAEKAILKRKGVKWDAQGNFKPITLSQQLDPELNILIGSIYIGQYADSLYGGKKDDTFWGGKDGVTHLDRIIVVYNSGGGGDDGLRARSGQYDTLQLANKVNSTSRTYIKKVMGVDGALDIITKEFKGIIG
jgi:soluble lytic murein transglycosylase-like protein